MTMPDPDASSPVAMTTQREGAFDPFARRKRRFARTSIRFILPNLLTLLALCSGITAIRYASEGKFDQAVWAVIIAAALDGLDGRIARVLKATSRFGAELDSLADIVDFGVAPGLILYFWNLHHVQSLGWLVVLLFAVAAAMRLARFNVMIDEVDKPYWTYHYFVGMPAPAAALLALAPLYAHLSIFDISDSPLFRNCEAIYLLTIACLMASRLPHFSAKSLGRMRRKNLTPVLFTAVALLLLLFNFPMEILLALSVIYCISIPFTILRAFRSERLRRRAAMAQAEH